MARIMRMRPEEIQRVADSMADLQQTLYLENDKVMSQVLGA